MMDPDIPLPSVEPESLPNANFITKATNAGSSGNNTPSRQRSRHTSPDKTPYKTPLSHAPTPLKVRTSSRSATPGNDRPSPILQSKRSFSNLSATQGPQYRRASSNLNPTSPGPSGKTGMMMDTPTRPSPWTASSVANDYFTRELSAHEGAQNKVTVIVHDACYGHRFSRPRATKAALATIVERPERILATLLGASAAYVRLGSRHAAGAFGPHPDRNPASAGVQPFSIRKTSRSVTLDHPAVTSVHGTKWMEELQIMCDSAEAKLALNGKELGRPIGYGRDEDGGALPKLHEGDLYLCAESLAALQGCLGGVFDAVDAVLSSEITTRAFVCIRPPGHHCSANYPSGFCWLNNVHVGISYASMNHGLTHAAIIDFDLHHGDGSQDVTWQHNQKAQALPKNTPTHKKTPIGYYSLHDINSYPCEWGDEDKIRNASLCIQNAHGQSIWNVHLEPWQSLEDFWQIYQAKYTILLDKTRHFLEHHSARLKREGIQPKAAIFLSAGFDASQWEGEGMQRHGVNVPTDFYAKFTEDVARLAEESGLGVDGRIISVLEGGYSDRALTSGVLSHLCGLTVEQSAGASFTGQSPIGSAAGPEMVSSGQVQAYDASWWNETSMQQVEAIVAGHLPAPMRKKDKLSGNYSSPTHASTQKMTENARERQSLHSQLEARLSFETAIVDPPPDVDWAVATYELSRILIPKDRTTLSCRHDELNAEATRVRRERQSVIGLPSVSGAVEEPRQLRDRKKVLTAVADGPRAASRTSNRRTTIAAASELPDSSKAEPLPDRPRRRSSAGSSVLSNFQEMKLENGMDSSTAGASVATASVRHRAGAAASKSVVTKKTRTTTAPRKPRSRATTPTNADTSKLHPLADRFASVKGQSESSNTRSSSLSRQSSNGSAGVTDGLDDLTTAMKKISIKLKMPTPEEHLANQRKVEEDKQKQIRQPRKPAIPRATKPKTATNTSKAVTQGKKSSPRSRPGYNSIEPLETGVGQTAYRPAVADSQSDENKIVLADSAQPEQLTEEHLQHLASDLASRVKQTQSIVPTASSQHSTTAPSMTPQSGAKETLPQPSFHNEGASIAASALPEGPPSIPARPEAPTPATVESSEIVAPKAPMIYPQQLARPAMEQTPRRKEELPVFTSTSPIPFSTSFASMNGHMKDR